MGAPHQFDGDKTLSPRAPSRSRRKSILDRSVVERRVHFWLAVLVLVVLALWLLSEILLLPFVAGLAIAYLLTPLTDRLERRGVNRLAAAFIIIAVVVLALVYLILLAAPIVGTQLTSFIDSVPGYVTTRQALPGDPSRPWLQKLLGASSADKSICDLVTQGVGWLTAFIRSVWSDGRALVSIFSLVVVPPVIAFYLIYDWHRMIRSVDSGIPIQHRDTVLELAREVNAAIAGFILGQTALCLILGSFYAGALPLTGLNFGRLIGLISGLITFILYVGSMTGLVLSLGVTVAQFWPTYGMMLIVLGIFLVGQFVEGNVLAPKLVGESVGIHPVWLIFALLAFGYLFGFVGLLVAVPLAATTGVLTRFALRLYLQSSLYTGRRRIEENGQFSCPAPAFAGA
jgi:predicted PurR-regulated permease PerM